MKIGLDPDASALAPRVGLVALASDDARDLTGMLALAAHEAAASGEGVGARLGVATEALAVLYALAGLPFVDVGAATRPAPDEEEQSVLDLLADELVETSPLSPFLPAILARRAMEPNHLWEDLGLSARPDLTALMTRHFPRLAGRNSGMRWKRFLYRSLCERQGFVACAAPSCSQCDEFSVCFDGEGGESRLAELRRAADLAAGS